MTLLQDLLRSLFGPRPVRPTPVVPPTSAPTPVPPTPVPPPGDVMAGLLEAHNAVRAGAGRPPLAVNPGLVEAARWHAALMASRGMMGHQLAGEPAFDARISAEGYHWSRVAENVAAGQASVAAVMAAWQGSPGHMANIVGPCTEMGGAMAVGANGLRYWSVSFASPAGAFGVSDAPTVTSTVFGADGTKIGRAHV